MIKFIFNKLFRIEIWQIAICNANFKNFLDSKGKVLKNYFEIKNPKFGFFADPFVVKVQKKKNSNYFRRILFF